MRLEYGQCFQHQPPVLSTALPRASLCSRRTNSAVRRCAVKCRLALYILEVPVRKRVC